MDRRTLGEMLLNWHDGMDHVYAVGSFYLNGETYPDRAIVESAADMLDRDRAEYRAMLRGVKVKKAHTNDLRAFAGYTVREMRANVRELSEIIAALHECLAEDYADGAA